MSDTEMDEEKGVYIFAHSDDEQRVDELGLIERLEKEGFTCYTQYESDPRSRTAGHDDIVNKCSKTILIVSQSSQSDRWINHCHTVAADTKTTIPIIIDEDMKIESLDLGIRRLLCLKVQQDGFWEKLVKALRCERFPRTATGLLAPGLVANYFFGFLKIVLPTIAKHLDDWANENETCVRRIIILMPRSCKCKENMEDYANDYIRLAYPDEPERSVVKCETNDEEPSRDYNQRMYRVQRPGSGEEEEEEEAYNVVLVLCSTMQSLYEMQVDPAMQLDIESMHGERDMFERMLRELLTKHTDCIDKAEMLCFDDDEGLGADVATQITEKCKQIEDATRRPSEQQE